MLFMFDFNSWLGTLRTNKSESSRQRSILIMSLFETTSSKSVVSSTAWKMAEPLLTQNMNIQCFFLKCHFRLESESISIFSQSRLYFLVDAVANISALSNLTASLSKHDVDDGEVIWKYHFAFLRSFFDYSNLLRWQNVSLTLLALNWCERFGDKKKELKICRQVLTSSTQLQSRSFHVMERTRTCVKCTKTKIARAKSGKLLFFIVKCAKFWRSCRHRNCGCLSSIIGSLSNHDDDGDKNFANMNIWQWKTIVLHALHVYFSFLDISQTFSFFPRREMTCFSVVWTTWEIW